MQNNTTFLLGEMRDLKIVANIRNVLRLPRKSRKQKGISSLVIFAFPAQNKTRNVTFASATVQNLAERPTLY